MTPSKNLGHVTAPGGAPALPRFRDRREWLGADHGGDRYQYVSDELRGSVSASRAVDTWVRTTCGYCSVGCGMLIGVRDDKARSPCRATPTIR